MKSFLIIGRPEDMHASYVRWALETAGYKPTLINALPGNCPTRITLYLDELSDDFTSREWDEAGAVWCRRLPRPPEPNHKGGEDEGFILMEQCRFTKWLIDLQESSTSIRWINRPTAIARAENKLVQLKSARAHGITVPRTLITADPGRFRAFLQTEGSVVAKPFVGYTWEYESGETFTTFANTIDAKRGSKLSDEDIAQCVTIYQQRIDKVADIRMVIMGQDVFTYKVIQSGEQHFDYRIGFYKNDHLTYEAISIPASLKKQMIRFMASVNVNFASADFALTSDGEFAFLDLNPSGQWLFLEHSSPETKVGQKFCSFFVMGRVDPDVEKLFPSYSEYLDSSEIRSVHEAFQQRLAGDISAPNLWKETKVS